MSPRPRRPAPPDRIGPSPAALHEHRAQVHAQFLDGRPAEEPVAVVDHVDDDQPGGAHDGVRDHLGVRGVGVFGDIQVALDDAAGGGQEGPYGIRFTKQLLGKVVPVAGILLGGAFMVDP